MNLPKESLKAVSSLKKEAESKMMERSEAIEGVFVALIAEQHAVFLGPPGTAKSMLTDFVCASADAIYFDVLLTKFSTPEEIFGPVSISDFKQGRFMRIVDNMLPQANVARVDEIFKANSSILNSLLTIINERKFYNGSAGPTDVPLVSLFGTSNELPESGELSALWDRFMLRYTTDYIAEDNNFRRLMKQKKVSSAKSKSKALKLSDLKKIHKARRQMKFPPSLIDCIVEIRSELRSSGIVLSDRRWKATKEIIKAKALLEGKSVPDKDDLDILRAALWNTPEERKTVSEIVLNVTNPDLKEALSIYDSCASVYKNAMESPEDERDGFGIEANKKFKQALKKMKRLERSGGAKVTELVEKVSSMQDDVLHYCLGVSDSYSDEGGDIEV